MTPVLWGSRWPFPFEPLFCVSMQRICKPLWLPQCSIDQLRTHLTHVSDVQFVRWARHQSSALTAVEMSIIFSNASLLFANPVIGIFSLTWTVLLHSSFVGWECESVGFVLESKVIRGVHMLVVSGISVRILFIVGLHSVRSRWLYLEVSAYELWTHEDCVNEVFKLLWTEWNLFSLEADKKQSFCTVSVHCVCMWPIMVYFLIE